MHVAVTADVHFGVPGRLDDIVWACRRIIDHCAQHSITEILMLGDLTHDREYLGLRELCSIVDVLEYAAKHGVHMRAFPGNHDMFMRNSWDINSLKPFSRHITCHHTVAKFELDGRRFWVLPFIHYEHKYMEVLRKLEQYHKDGDVLLTHIGVRAASLNTCFGLKSWSVVDFVQSPFKWVYTGHFHSTQQVGNNVWYPGSPIPFKADEGDVDHGFFVLDTDTMQHQFVSIWEGVQRDEHTPPQYLTIDEDDLDKANGNIQGNIIRVALSKDYTSNQKLEIRHRLEQLGARDVRWLDLASKEQREKIQLAKATAGNKSLFTRFREADRDGVAGLDETFLEQLNLEVTTEGDQRYEFPDGEE